jgi:hypothetical protein
MKAKNKEEFIKAWKEEIKVLHLLKRQTSDVKIEVKFNNILNELDDLLLVVANEVYSEEK